MSGVFVSYSRVDRALAHRIVVGLRRLGVDVWWDEDMPGVDWQLELQRKIQELGAVVVLWSPASLESKNVRDEARLGLGAEKLVNVLVGVAEPPFPFDRVNGLDLAGWAGAESTPGWTRLIRTLEPLLASGGVTSGALAAAQSEHDKQIRERRGAFAQAQDAFSAAQARLREAAEAEEEDTSAMRRAEKRLQASIETRAAAAIAEAAQRDFDAARLRRDEAEKAHRAARQDLSQASQALTVARSQLENLLNVEPAPGHAAPPPQGAPGGAVPREASKREAGRAGSRRRDTPQWVDPEVIRETVREAKRARRERRDRNRPVIGVGGLIVLSIVGLVIWNQVNRPKRAVKNDIILASALAHLPCAWLEVRPASVDGKSGVIVSGAAGDPTAASSAVSALAVADGVPPGAVDTDGVRRFDNRLCDAVTVLNERRHSRSSSAPRLEVAPGAAGQRTTVTLVTGDSDEDFVLLWLGPDGAVQPVALGVAVADKAGLTAAKSNPDVTAAGDGVWRLVLPAGRGARGLALITGDGPFSPAVVGGVAGARGEAWQKRFRAAAEDSDWRTTIAWLQGS
ncbi:MAG TPA: TIR domain-containing protein [Caulobacteraceae bacterium]|nr:TIR domain-containing protein [Caulobacteraceae bacterium]